MNKNNYIYLFIGFMFGIIVAIIINMLCSRKIRNRIRNIGNLIFQRQLQIIPQPNKKFYIDNTSDNSSYSEQYTIAENV